MIFNLANIIHGTGASVLSVDRLGSSLEGNLAAADLETEYADVVVDSRNVVHGSLFVALPGARTDGHAFVGESFQRGARAALVSSAAPREPLLAGMLAAQRLRGASLFLLVVDDPLAALQRLAAYWRRLSRAEIVGVTGSIGKTTTKEVAASMAGHSRTVLKSHANLNTEIGLPLELLRLRDQHEVAVLEMGMFGPGEISLLAGIAAPRIGIVTNVAPVHLERMGTIERIARAKSELIAALPPEGLAVLNADDPWTRAMAETSGIARVALVGVAPDATYRATDVEAHGLSGLSLRVHAEGHQIRLEAPVPGAHLVHALLSGIAVCREIGMEWNEIRDAMAGIEMTVRQRIVRRPDGFIVIDDSYNAAPMSMAAALELLRASPGTRVAILGDMLELGPGEELAHKQVGAQAADVADWLIAQGPRAAWIADGAREMGFPAAHIVRTMSNEDAAERALDLIASKVPVLASGAGSPPEAGAVLVKGSRGMRMEQVVERLTGGRG